MWLGWCTQSIAGSPSGVPLKTECRDVVLAALVSPSLPCTSHTSTCCNFSPFPPLLWFSITELKFLFNPRAGEGEHSRLEWCGCGAEQMLSDAGAAVVVGAVCEGAVERGGTQGRWTPQSVHIARMVSSSGGRVDAHTSQGSTAGTSGTGTTSHLSAMACAPLTCPCPASCCSCCCCGCCNCRSWWQCCCFPAWHSEPSFPSSLASSKSAESLVGVVAGCLLVSV